MNEPKNIDQLVEANADLVKAQLELVELSKKDISRKTNSFLIFNVLNIVVLTCLTMVVYLK